MSRVFKADLHVHSTFSDGTLTPTQLIDKAVELGLSAIALTDHDSTNGVAEFQRAAQGKPIQTIAGVEVSADFSPGTMHLLGYFVAPAHPNLARHLEWIREGRLYRNREILHRLVQLGFHLTWDEVAAYAGEDNIGRPHFASAMVAKGYARDRNDAFRKYLARGKPAYADRRRLPPGETMALIREAGGLPVLAHPVTLDLGPWELRRLLTDLRNKGLEGMEIYYPEHGREQLRQYRKLAKTFGLVATGGTDFHGAATADMAFGPPLGSLAVPADLIEGLEQRRAQLYPQVE